MYREVHKYAYLHTYTVHNIYEHYRVQQQTTTATTIMRGLAFTSFCVCAWILFNESAVCVGRFACDTLKGNPKKTR